MPFFECMPVNEQWIGRRVWWRERGRPFPGQHAEGECSGLLTHLRKIQQRSANDSFFKFGSRETVDRHSGNLSEPPGHLKRRDRLSRPVAPHWHIEHHRIKWQSSHFIQHGLQRQLVQPAGANPGRKALQDLACFIVPLLLLGSRAADANDLSSFGLQLERQLCRSLIVPSHREPGDIRWHFRGLHLTKIHIRQDNRHARKELVSVRNREFQRGTPDRDHYVWLSRRVPRAEVTHEIALILSRRETPEIEVFGENFQIFRLPTGQASHQTLLRRFHGRDGQPIPIEHEHCFFQGADGFEPPTDLSVAPRNPEQREVCE